MITYYTKLIAQSEKKIGLLTCLMFIGVFILDVIVGPY